MTAATQSQQLTWEQAVEWLRRQPGQEQLVKWCFFDDPLIDAVKRYAASGEWQAVSKFLPAPPGKALDLGAGRGISSYALACGGWSVTALEPDPSDLVGAGAIRKVAQETGADIRVVTEYGENLPFQSETFDVVYGRQVLHHARNLQHFMTEAHRVLKPGGTFIATREHVLSKKEDMQAFLDSHPLHHLYGGENAFLLGEYTDAIRSSGLVLTKVLGSFDNPINYFPASEEELDYRRLSVLQQRFGSVLSARILASQGLIGRFARKYANGIMTAEDQTPGRMYSFVAQKLR